MPCFPACQSAAGGVLLETQAARAAPSVGQAVQSTWRWKQPRRQDGARWEQESARWRRPDCPSRNHVGLQVGSSSGWGNGQHVFPMALGPSPAHHSARATPATAGTGVAAAAAAAACVVAVAVSHDFGRVAPGTTGGRGPAVTCSGLYGLVWQVVRQLQSGMFTGG